MAPLLIPSVHTIRSALQEIEGAIKLEPLSEETAAGDDPGTLIIRLDPDELGSKFEDYPHGFREEGPSFSEDPAVVFEVPPKLTDAEVVNALGEGFGKRARLLQIKGIDALGWYMTFHQRAVQHGIYLPIEGIAQLAVTALRHLALPLERRLEIAFHAILRHELFHFAADCMAANWELATRAVVYWWAAEEFRANPGYKDLEEALANAYMLRGLRHPSGVLRNSRGSYELLKAFCVLQPPRYRDGPRYAKSLQDYAEGCRALSANFAEATPDNIALSVHALDTLMFYPNPFQIDWRRCPILVHDRLGILNTLAIGVDLFEAIGEIAEFAAFSKSIARLGPSMTELWERRKADLARSVSLSSLGFQRWKPGGADCYSVRVDGNYRAHLRRDSANGSWIAEAIGDHKSMGHG